MAELVHHLLATLRRGPVWLRSLKDYRPLVSYAVEKGWAERVKPGNGRACNMLAATPEGEAEYEANGGGAAALGLPSGASQPAHQVVRKREPAPVQRARAAPRAMTTTYARGERAKDLPPERYEDRDPCFYCGVTGMVGCKHRRARP